MADDTGYAAVDEWYRQLLRQRADGKLLAFAKSGRAPRPGLRHPSRGDPQRVRLYRGLVQHDTAAFKFGLQISRAV